MRRSSRPRPGQPSGNAENSRCNPLLLAARSRPSSEAQNEHSRRNRDANPCNMEYRVTTIVVEEAAALLFLQLDDAAAHRDRDGLGAIAGIEFFHDVFDVDLDRLF